MIQLAGSGNGATGVGGTDVPPSGTEVGGTPPGAAGLKGLPGDRLPGELSAAGVKLFDSPSGCVGGASGSAGAATPAADPPAGGTNAVGGLEINPSRRERADARRGSAAAYI